MNQNNTLPLFVNIQANLLEQQQEYLETNSQARSSSLCSLEGQEEDIEEEEE